MAVEWFRSTSVDETVVVGNLLFSQFHLEPAHHSRYGVELATAEVGPIASGLVGFSCPVHIDVDGLDADYVVVISVRGTYAGSIDGTEFVVDPSTAYVVCPGQSATLNGFGGPDDRLLLLRFDRQLLEGHLRTLIGVDPGPIRFDPTCDISSGPGAQWWSIVRTVAAALESGDSWVLNPLISPSISSAILAGFLHSAIHPFREQLDTSVRPVLPYVIRRAMQIINEQPDQLLTIPQLARQVGCNARTLQLGFQRYLNMTPGQLLRRVRMDRIHAELVSSTPETASVATIARRWGVEANGRFAARYRSVYGVSPSATLRGRAPAR